MVMQGICVCTRRGGKQAEVSDLMCVCVCFSGQKGPFTRLCGGFNSLEIQLHSTNLETRGLCLCIHIASMLKHSPFLNSDERAQACPIPSQLSAFVYVYTVFPAAESASAASTAQY